MFRELLPNGTLQDLPGTGLGLSLVKAIAELHDGSVTLSDNEPGLRVAVRFPAVRP